jgi:hypothetical protein
MADGDVTIKILYSHNLGGGRDANGVPKQNKRFVVGQIDGTYVSTGLNISKHGGPQAFGVNNLDYIFIEPIKLNAADPDSEKLFFACYDHANDLIFVAEDLGQSTPGDPENAEAVVLRFIAIGDDATVPAV